MDYIEVHDEDVVYYLRDKNAELVAKWTEHFAQYQHVIKVSNGDIFQGAPAADAIVSPGNSFGFMTGAMDSACKRHFGTQIETNLQKMIREKYDGELLVGQAAIVPIGEENIDDSQAGSQADESSSVKFLIYAPSMRSIGMITNTPNAYLAFKAVILAISKHNRKRNVSKIRQVLVPGFGTGPGGMPKDRCAWQMLQAYETHALGKHRQRLVPTHLVHVITDEFKMLQFGSSIEEVDLENP